MHFFPIRMFPPSRAVLQWPELPESYRTEVMRVNILAVFPVLDSLYQVEVIHLYS